MIAPACKICGAPATYVCTLPNGLGSVTRVHICRCTECGLVFVGNCLSDENLSEAYGLLDSTRYYCEIEKENGAKCQSACRFLKSLTGGGLHKRILDVGCGNGQFLQELRRQGFQSLYGHEIPGADLSHIEKLNITLYRDMNWSSVPSDYFDVITLLDVAEHVPRPLELFQQCFRMLRSDGCLYFHTPVVTPFDRLMQTVATLPAVGKLGRVWQQGRTNIFHLQNYTDRSLQIALSKAGFENCEVRKRNELSWPVQRYVRVHVCENHGLPLWLVPILTVCLYPLLATDRLNSNKGIVTAMRPASSLQTQ